MKKLLTMMVILTILTSCQSTDDNNVLTTPSCSAVNALTLDGMYYEIPDVVQDQTLEVSCEFNQGHHGIYASVSDYPYIQHLNADKIVQIGLGTNQNVSEGTLITDGEFNGALIVKLDETYDRVYYRTDVGYDIYTTIDEYGVSHKCIDNALFINSDDESDSFIASLSLKCTL